MTVQELHTLFKVLTDKVDTQSLPDFSISEVDLFLNLAQDRLIKTRYGLNNVYKKGFEQTQKRIDDLRTVEVTRYKQLTPVEKGIKAISLNGFYQDINLSVVNNDQYMFLTKLVVRTNKKTCTNKSFVAPKFCQSDDIDILLEDPFNKPSIKNRPLYTFENNSIYIYYDSDNMEVDIVRISFIKVPDKISYRNNVTSVLSSNIHNDLVFHAVQIALENIESQRVESNQAINLNNLE